MILLKSLFIFLSFVSKSDPPNVGERLTLASCGACHLGDDGRLSGKQMTDVPRSLGKIYSANITNDKENGIGNWSRESIKELIRTGTKPDGSKANIMMPRYKKMAESDLDAIVDFLRSGNGAALASKEKTQTSKLSAPAKMAPAIKKINKGKPAPVAKPDTLQYVAYGKYLIDEVLHCYSCHSASPMSVDFKNADHSKGYLGGGSKFPGGDGSTIISLNLTFDKETGMGNYSLNDFITVMKTGRRKNGEWLRYPMLPYPMLTDNDLTAIYQYLATVPVIKNKKLK